MFRKPRINRCCDFATLGAVAPARCFSQHILGGFLAFIWHLCYSHHTMLTKTKKQKVIAVAKIHDVDTGSPEVQIALLSKRIEDLAAHLKKNTKDTHSRRGLLQMVADRQKHMKYLQKKSTKRFNAIMKKLELKKKA